MSRAAVRTAVHFTLDMNRDFCYSGSLSAKKTSSWEWISPQSLRRPVHFFVIAKENISHPLLTKEFLYSWFDGFKNFDVNKLKNRKMLIDTFVNSVVLYDDRIDFYFNFKDNAKSLTLSELNTVSDLSSSSPSKKQSRKWLLFFNQR